MQLASAFAGFAIGIAAILYGAGLFAGTYRQWLIVTGAVVVFLGGCFLLVGCYCYGLGRRTAILETRCPFCGATQVLYAGTRSHICTGCGRILLLDDGIRDMDRITCPNCGTEWGVPLGRPQATCFSCGLALGLAVSGYEPLAEDSRCPGCDSGVQGSAYYCRRCGELLVEPSTEMSVPGLGPCPPTRTDGLDAICLMAKPDAGRLVDAAVAVRKAGETVRHLLREGSTPPASDQLRVLSVLSRAVESLGHVGPDGQLRAPALARACRRSLAEWFDATIDWAAGKIRGTRGGDASTLRESYAKGFKLLATNARSVAGGESWVVPVVPTGPGFGVTVKNGPEVQEWVQATLAEAPADIAYPLAEPRAETIRTAGREACITAARPQDAEAEPASVATSGEADSKPKCLWCFECDWIVLEEQAGTGRCGRCGSPAAKVKLTLQPNWDRLAYLTALAVSGSVLLGAARRGSAPLTVDLSNLHLVIPGAVSWLIVLGYFLVSYFSTGSFFGFIKDEYPCDYTGRRRKRISLAGLMREAAISLWVLVITALIVLFIVAVRVILHRFRG